jgi:hypothetical protein
MPDVISDNINAFFKLNIAGIPLWAILGLIVVIVYLFILKNKPKEDKYRNIELRKEVRREIKQIFDVSEKNLGYGKILCIGPTKIGFIYKMINYNWSKTLNSFTEIKTVALQNEKPHTNLKSFYGFKVGRKGLLNRINILFGKGTKYYFVDANLVTFNPFEIVINPYSQYTDFIDVILFSQAGKEIIEDIAFKITLEKTLEAMVNHIPMMEYLEVNLAKTVAKYRELTKLEKEKYEGKIEKMVEDE